MTDGKVQAHESGNEKQPHGQEKTASLCFEDTEIGQSAAFEAFVSAGDIDRFAELSGDNNPLHIDSAFARARGFADRVVHGAYLAALVSRLVGVHLPGRNCILHSMNLQFKAPLIVESRVRVEGVIEQRSEAVRAAVLKVTIIDLADNRTVASGKAHLGFTDAAA